MKNKALKIHDGYKKYYPYYNGWKPYLVCIKDFNVKIYKKSNNIINSEKNCEFKKSDYYNDFLIEYEIENIFLGISPNSKYSDDGANKGNSILLYLGIDKYVFIGYGIFEFTIKDKINSFFSLMSGNQVNYPVAIGSENIYFMLDKKFISNVYFKDINNNDLGIAYMYYYGLEGNEPLEKYAKNIIDIKDINISSFY